MQDHVLTPQAQFAARFVLLEQLHNGSKCEVWLAEDTRAQIPVALKILSQAAADRVELRELFEAEWQIARGLNHPHTVRALSWHGGERPAYAMQYIDGTDASDLVGKGVAVWGSVIRVIAESLDYWHRKGVVHGDLKPSNILLDRRGSTYLGDFGTARLIDSDTTLASRGGTVAYASPEQQAGEQPTPADDVFALAQVVAELATGDPSAAYPESAPAAVRALLTAARGAPAERPSMAELAASLEAAGLGREHVDLRAVDVPLRRPASSIAGAEPAPLPALPHGAFERDVQVVERHGVSPLLIVGGLLAVLVFGVLFTQGLQWLSKEEPESEAQVVDTTDDATTEEPAAEAPEPADTADADDSPDERRAVDDLVSELLQIDDALIARSVSLWGGVAYETGKQRYDEGDRAYLARDFELAKTRYADAIALMKPLLEIADVEYQRAMDAGDAAFFAEDSVAAVASFERALSITPNDPAATQSLQRAKRLDEVLTELRSGLEEEAAGNLVGARARFDAALVLDPQWQPAIEARARVSAAIRADRFASRMSEGFAALAREDFAAARSAFGAARAVRNDPSVADALLQVTLAERQNELQSGLETARSHESNEAWVAARDAYATLLEEDPNLDVARAGLVRTQERIDVLARARSFLDNPDQLSEIDALRSASRLLTRMNELEPRGPQFAGETERLSTLLRAAAVPIPVQLQSDGKTDITVLRVAQLGTFTETELRLRPGLYTVVGSRRGFIDARRQFRVVSGQPPQPVYIACEQPI
ncbi:MAG: protein kinase [Pseudomonadota bacterium]